MSLGSEGSDVEVVLEAWGAPECNKRRGKSPEIIEICSSDSEDEDENVSEIAAGDQCKPDHGAFTNGKDLLEIDLEEFFGKGGEACGEEPDHQEKDTARWDTRRDRGHRQGKTAPDWKDQRTLKDLPASEAGGSDEESYSSYYSAQSSVPILDTRTAITVVNHSPTEGNLGRAPLSRTCLKETKQAVADCLNKNDWSKNASNILPKKNPFLKCADHAARLNDLGEANNGKNISNRGNKLESGCQRASNPRNVVKGRKRPMDKGRKQRSSKESYSKHRRQSPRCIKSPLDLRRELQTSVTVVQGSDQSDPKGAGIVAQRLLRKGEVLYDFSAMYSHGDPPSNLDHQRADYIKTTDGYFLLIATTTEWLNEAQGDQEPNIEWGKGYFDNTNDCGSHHVLMWKVLCDIEKGEELLVQYGHKKTIPCSEHTVQHTE